MQANGLLLQKDEKTFGNINNTLSSSALEKKYYSVTKILTKIDAALFFKTDIEDIIINKGLPDSSLYERVYLTDLGYLSVTSETTNSNTTALIGKDTNNNYVYAIKGNNKKRAKSMPRNEDENENDEKHEFPTPQKKPNTIPIQNIEPQHKKNTQRLIAICWKVLVNSLLMVIILLELNMVIKHYIPLII